MVETYGLSHIALAVADPVRSARFYVEVFGFAIAYEDGAKIELQMPGRHDVITFERSAEHVGATAGIAHFGFRLIRASDIDAAVQSVLDAGGTIDSRGEFSPGYPFAFARDLDGYPIEIWFE